MYPYPSLIRDGILLPDSDPYQLFRSGNYHQVPIMTGTNRDESKIFMAFNPEFVPGGLPLLIKDPDYFNLAAYYQSTLWRARSVDEFARATANQQHAVYAYRFDWDEAPKILWNDLSILIGASHFFEIPFVFNTPDTFTVKLGSPLVFTPSQAEGRQILANSMSSYWAAFAYHGDPGKGVNDSESVAWTPWQDDPDVSNIILFDSINDSGIQMVSSHVSVDGLRDELQQEQGFKDPDKQCAWYQQLFGFDTWFADRCVP
jgi:para-nitrobenzyl esterase